MFNIIFILLLVIVNSYGLYFLITGLFAFNKNDKKKTKSKKINNFAILVAARNEEKVIGNLIDSLNKLNYDKDKYSINIVINNCTDHTREIVESKKVNIIDCKSEIHTKGDALKEAFELLDSESIDAYIIFDADNIVHKDFLKHMNESINSGYKVAQCFRDTKNPSDNWLSSSYALFYYIQNFFFNKARKVMNLSSSINGTGFMVKKEVIDEIGFDTISLTEDVEFTGICAINNIKIDFVENAITYDEQPVHFDISCKQRERWSKGNIQCLCKYYKDLLKSLFKNSNLSCLDMLLEYFAPILQLLSFILFCVISVYNINIINDAEDIALFLLEEVLISILISVLLSSILSLIVLVSNKKKIRNYFSGIILFAFFIFSWIPINIIMLFKRDIKWSHIEHNKDVSIENFENVTNK